MDSEISGKESTVPEGNTQKPPHRALPSAGAILNVVKLVIVLVVVYAVYKFIKGFGSFFGLVPNCADKRADRDKAATLLKSGTCCNYTQICSDKNSCYFCEGGHADQSPSKTGNIPAGKMSQSGDYCTSLTRCGPKDMYACKTKKPVGGTCSWDTAAECCESGACGIHWKDNPDASQRVKCCPSKTSWYNANNQGFCMTYRRMRNAPGTSSVQATSARATSAPR